MFIVRDDVPRVDGRGEMVIELPLDVGEAGSLASSSSTTAAAATDPVAGSPSERHVMMPHSGREEVQDEGLHVGQVGVVAAELVHVPPHF